MTASEAAHPGRTNVKPGHQKHLVVMARLWPTMCASKKTGTTRKDFSISLPEAVKLFPTPTSRDWKDGTAEACKNVAVNGLLGRVVHLLPTPRATDGTKGIRTQQGAIKERERRKNGQNLPTIAGGSLNPDWVEWLMGYPIGHTVLDASETQSFRKSPKSSRAPSDS